MDGEEKERIQNSELRIENSKGDKVDKKEEESVVDQEPRISKLALTSLLIGVASFIVVFIFIISPFA